MLRVRLPRRSAVATTDSDQGHPPDVLPPLPVRSTARTRHWRRIRRRIVKSAPHQLTTNCLRFKVTGISASEAVARRRHRLGSRADLDKAAAAHSSQEPPRARSGRGRTGRPWARSMSIGCRCMFHVEHCRAGSQSMGRRTAARSARPVGPIRPPPGLSAVWLRDGLTRPAIPQQITEAMVLTASSSRLRAALGHNPPGRHPGC